MENLETIDERTDQFPAEAVLEIKSMSTWMTFSGVIVIIMAILSLLGNLTMLSQGGAPGAGISIVTNGISIYLGFLIIRKSGLFNAYADNRNEAELIAALKLTKLYWMISVIMIIVSILISILIK